MEAPRFILLACIISKLISCIRFCIAIKLIPQLSVFLKKISCLWIIIVLVKIVDVFLWVRQTLLSWFWLKGDFFGGNLLRLGLDTNVRIQSFWLRVSEGWYSSHVNLMVRRLMSFAFPYAVLTGGFTFF